MKFLIIIPFFLLLSTVKIDAQDTICKKILFGLETGAAGSHGKDPDTGVKYKVFTLRLAPYAGVFFLKNRINVGITGEYSFYKSNFDEKPIAYGLGAFVRYCSPFRIKKIKLLRERLSFYGEFSYNKVNYYQGKNGVVAFNDLRQTVLRFSLGYQVRLWKQLYFDRSIRPQIYVGRNRFPLSQRVGFEYHF